MSIRPGDTSEDCNVLLSQLIRQLLRNLSQQSLRKLQRTTEPTDLDEEDSESSSETNPGLSFLLRFQRLLIGQLYSEDEREIQLAANLLSKYVNWLCSHAIDSLEAFLQFIEQLPAVELENSSAFPLLFRSSIIGKRTNLKFFRLIIVKLVIIIVLLSETIVGLITIERRRCEQVVRLPLNELTSVLALFDKAIRVLPQETCHENTWSPDGKSRVHPNFDIVKFRKFVLMQ